MSGADDFKSLIAALNEMQADAAANLEALANAVRANPDDAELKARYTEAKTIVSEGRAFARGGAKDEAGNLIGGLRGIVGERIIEGDD